VALAVFHFSNGQGRTHIPRQILGYIRILARIWPKTRILTTSAQEQHVELLNGTKVPMRIDGARKGHPIASVSAV